MSRRIFRPQFLIPNLVVAISLIVFLSGCADRLLLFPSRNAVPTAGLVQRKIPFAGSSLEAWISRTPTAKRDEDLEGYVLAFCGNASRAEFLAPEVAQELGDRRLEVWALNYPGFGGSDGKAKLNQLAPAGLAAYDALAPIAAGKPIVVYGESMGTTVSLYLASKRPVTGMILLNPPPLRRMILQKHGWWNLWLIALPVAFSVPIELNAIDTAPRVQAPGIFMTSQNDTVVPRKYQDLVFEAYAGPKTRLFKPGDHNDGCGPKTVQELRAAVTAIWPR